MSFWLRYILMVIACVVVPVVASLFESSEGQLSAAKADALERVMTGPRAVDAVLLGQVQGLISRAQNLAQSVGGDVAKRKDVDALSAPAGGFAWAVGSDGSILGVTGAIGKKGASIAGHPLFIETQSGFALDGIWAVGDKLFQVGATPVVDSGVATGAILVGEAIDTAFVERLAKSSGVDVSLVINGAVAASSLTGSAAKAVADATASSADSVLAGTLDKPLDGAGMFIDKSATGFAYASISRPIAGLESVRWVTSVPTIGILEEGTSFHSRVLGICGAAFLLALIVGFTLFKDFVRPVDQLIDHLSGLQQGKGDLELPEIQVARPFRRLVKLVNWAVQRSPASSFADSGDLKLKRPPPAETGSALTGSDFATRPQQTPSSKSPTPVPKAPEPVRGVEMDSDAEPSHEDILDSFPDSKSAPVPAAPAPKSPPSGSIDAVAAAAIAQLTDKKPNKEIRGRPANEIRGAPAAELKPANEIRGVSPNEIRGTPATAVRSSGELPGAPMNRGGPTGDLPPVSLPDLGDIASGLPMMPGLGGFPGSGQGPFPGGPGTLPLSDDAFAGLVQGIGEIPGGPSADLDVPAVKMGGSAMMGGSAAMEDMGFGMAGLQDEDPGGFRSEATAVGAPSKELIAQSARDIVAAGLSMPLAPDRTAVAQVPKDLLAQSSMEDDEDSEEEAHFKETYQRFLEMRKICGETTDDLGYDKFLIKLQKNKSELQKKYNCKTVRFQVYQKNGKAALKATPIRN